MKHALSVNLLLAAGNSGGDGFRCFTFFDYLTRRVYVASGYESKERRRVGSVIFVVKGIIYDSYFVKALGGCICR